jgi:hypothetical protein
MICIVLCLDQVLGVNFNSSVSTPLLIEKLTRINWLERESAQVTVGTLPNIMKLAVLPGSGRRRAELGSLVG